MSEPTSKLSPKEKAYDKIAIGIILILILFFARFLLEYGEGKMFKHVTIVSDILLWIVMIPAGYSLWGLAKLLWVETKR